MLSEMGGRQRGIKRERKWQVAEAHKGGEGRCQAWGKMERQDGEERAEDGESEQERRN